MSANPLDTYRGLNLQTASPCIAPPNIRTLLISKDEAALRNIQQALESTPSQRQVDAVYLMTCEKDFSCLENPSFLENYDVAVLELTSADIADRRLLETLHRVMAEYPVVTITDSSLEYTQEHQILSVLSEASACLVRDEIVPSKFPEVLERTVRHIMRCFDKVRSLKDSERTKELFYATLAHDLKTPIFAEQKILEHFASGKFGPLSVEQQEITQELVRSNRYLFQMVSNLLSSYKYQHHQKKLKKIKTDYPAMVETLAREQLRPLANEKGQKIELECEAGVGLVRVDPVEINRVIFNLVHNALNYSPENSTIVLRILPKADDPSLLMTQIVDHGPGIHAEKIPELFQPYATVKTLRTVGTGLGLYLARQIVEAHGGHIGVSSTPGQGCCFYFVLPS